MAPVGAIADIEAVLRPLIPELRERAQPIGRLLLHVALRWFQQACEVYVFEYCRFFYQYFCKARVFFKYVASSYAKINLVSLPQIKT